MSENLMPNRNAVKWFRRTLALSRISRRLYLSSATCAEQGLGWRIHIMPYPEELVRPMRQELTSIGVKELRTAAEVDQFMAEKSGTSMIVINSVCGCAAGGARPGVRLALQNAKKPDRVATVFAGND